MEKRQKSFWKQFAFLLCISAILIPAGLSAQGKLQFGVNAGLDFTMLTGVGEVHPRPGFSVHGVSSLTIIEKLSLQASLGYAFRPYHLQADEIILSTDIDPNQGVISTSRLVVDGSYHEFQLPVLLKFHLQSTHKGPYIGAGPMVALAVGHSGSGELIRGNGSVEQVSNVGYRPEPKVALQACLGHRMPLTPATDLSVELYGNAYANWFFLAPARNLTAGARVGLWL
ncbi:MAG: porin family protein [Bacteroidia bacterium]